MEKLIPCVKCDGYILSDGTACLSERSTAKLLRMKQTSLQSVAPKWFPKTLKPFIDNDFNVAPKSTSPTKKNFLNFMILNILKFNIIIIKRKILCKNYKLYTTEK